MPERVVLPALLCAGLLLLAGCGGAPAATSAPVSPPPERLSLLYQFAGQPSTLHLYSLERYAMMKA